MKARRHFGPRGDRDLRQILAYLAESRPRSAIRFQKSFKATSQRLCRHPGLGEPYIPEDPTIQSVRRNRVTGFPNYVIYYAQIPAGLTILRVIHSAREPSDLITPEDFESSEPIPE
jgi:toxin ParE1/3/4